MLKWLLKYWKKMFFAGIILVALGIGTIYLSHAWMVSNSKDRLYTSVETIPENDIGLLLGTIKELRNGRPNPYFTYRIKATAELYKAGKIKHVLVSGDNSRRSYNEPEDMQLALIKAGVPENAITLDFAGFRTFDSMIRCQKVFQQNKVTIISQQFHNERAVFIADYLGMEVVGFNAVNIWAHLRTKTKAREYLARCKAILDLYILNTTPKFLGEKINITINKIDD